MKLNLCCGEGKLKDFVNIDKETFVGADLVLDLTKEKYPYEDNSIEEVWIMHGIEHIERKKWDFLLMEIVRVLKPNGKFILGYPEFSKCADAFISNRNMQKEFWVATLYGRQKWAGDYHVAPCHSPDLQEILESYGFYRVRYSPESTSDDYNTVMVCYKDPSPMCREVEIAKQLGLGKAKSIEMI